jgi:hypothetical protein
MVDRHNAAHIQAVLRQALDALASAKSTDKD